MKELNKVAGGLHKTSIDPANLLSEKDADPLGVYKLQDKGTVMTAAATPGSPVMPDADSEAVAAARRRKMAAMKQRGGRASTVLGGEDRLGG